MLLRGSCVLQYFVHAYMLHQVLSGAWQLEGGSSSISAHMWLLFDAFVLNLGNPMDVIVHAEEPCTCIYVLQVSVGT